MRIQRLSRALVVTVVAAIAIAPASTARFRFFPPAHRDIGCHPPKSRTVLRSKTVEVFVRYRRDAGPDAPGGYETWACRPGIRRAYRLNDPHQWETVYPWPLAAAGRLVAFVFDSQDDIGPDFTEYTSIRVLDSRTGRDMEPTGPKPPDYTPPGNGFGPDAVDPSQSGSVAASLVVDRRGQVAWIICPVDSETTKGCRGGTAWSRVYMHRSGRYLPEEIGHGRIRLDSLRLRAGVLSWRQDGTYRQHVL